MKKILLVLFAMGINSVCLAADPQTTASFKVQATLEKGCSLTNSDQNMDFGRHSAILQEKVTSSIINTAATWNIKCTEKLPVNIILDGGENLSNNIRRMKHISSSEYINYKLYTSNSLDTEYLAGNSYSIQPTTAANPILDFSIYGVADLDNNNQPRSAGIYKDTVSILITW